VKAAGGIEACFERQVLEPLRAAARDGKVALVDIAALVAAARAGGGAIEDHVASDGRSLTEQGALIAARYTALWLLRAMDKRTTEPTVAEALGGRAPAPPPTLPAAPASSREAIVGKVWTQDLEPQYRAVIADRNSDLRLDAFVTYSQWVPFREDLVGFYLDLLGDSDRSLAQAACQALQGLVEAGADQRQAVRKAAPALLAALEDADEDVAALAAQVLVSLGGAGSDGLQQIAAGLFAIMRREKLESFLGERALGVLSDILVGSLGGSGGRPRPKAPGEAGQAKDVFSDVDLDLLAAGLGARSEEVRQYAAALLVEAGDRGVRRVGVALKELPEGVALKIMAFAVERSRSGRQAPVRDLLIALAGASAAGQIRTESRTHLLSNYESTEIPFEILVDAALEERGTTREVAIAKLISRNVESVEVLARWLAAPEPDIADTARRALVHLGLFAASDEVARRALGAVREYRGAGEVEFMVDIGVALGLAVACEPTVAATLPIVPRSGTKMPSIPSRRGSVTPRPTATYRSPVTRGTPTRPGTSEWVRETREARTDRLADFVPLFEKYSAAAGERERAVATALLFDVWKSLVETPAPRPAPPQREAATPSLAKRLIEETWQALSGGDRAGAIAKARRAIAAGADVKFVNDMAWRLAVSATEGMRDGAEAERLARLAIERGGSSSQHLDTLAAALAAQGKFKEALDAEFDALAPMGSTPEATQYIKRALFYLVQRPYTESWKRGGASEEQAAGEPAAPPESPSHAEALRDAEKAKLMEAMKAADGAKITDAIKSARDARKK
jgi:hypothetical protein